MLGAVTVLPMQGNQRTTNSSACPEEQLSTNTPDDMYGTLSNSTLGIYRSDCVIDYSAIIATIIIKVLCIQELKMSG